MLVIGLDVTDRFVVIGIDDSDQFVLHSRNHGHGFGPAGVQ